MQSDVTIVGCGVAGLSAAYPLVKAGARVVMLDAGEEPRKKFGWRYPLIGWRAGYGRIRKEADTVIVESFVPGGMSEIWGGVCERLTDEELRAAGMPNLDEHYDTIVRRIGLDGSFSNYRGHTTLEELKKYPNFEYRRQLVTEVPRNTRFTILACGAVGTNKLLGKELLFYKLNILNICLSFRSLPIGGFRPVLVRAVGASYMLVYSLFPFTAVADVRGEDINLREFGLFPVFRLRLPKGSTSHYAGGVLVDENGKYADGVYVADASGWTALPAKPVTLTIMANADRVGKHIARLLGL